MRDRAHWVQCRGHRFEHFDGGKLTSAARAIAAVHTWLIEGPGDTYTIPCSRISVARTIAMELKNDHGLRCTVETPDYDRWFCGAPHKVVEEDGEKRLVRVFYKAVVHRPEDGGKEKRDA
jgi:hypothetical protein